MFRWRTAEVKTIVERAFGATVSVESPGGDYDTETLVVDLPGDRRVNVFGMLLDEPVEKPDDCEVVLLFVNTSKKYGLNSGNDGETMGIIGKILTALGAEGYREVTTSGWEDYF